MDAALVLKQLGDLERVKSWLPDYRCDGRMWEPFDDFVGGGHDGV